MRQVTDWLLIATEGAVIGLAASHLSTMTGKLDLVLDVSAGACGSLVLAWFIAPLSASGSVLTVQALGLSALGAVFVVCLAKLLRR